jgi:CubicO group peptidase (beta-lactamase class C family)
VTMLSHSTPIEPGFHYDNLGYVVASLALERITGKPWQVVLRDLVFAPLGMNHTTAYMSVAQQGPMATPYIRGRDGAMEAAPLQKNDRMMHAAGGIVTTPEDLARWLNANILRRGGDIPAAAFEEAQKMQTPVVIARGDFKSSGYGFGWYQAGFNGERALFHMGGFPGWQSSFSFLPDRKIGVGVMTNASGLSLAAVQAVTSYADDRLLGKAHDTEAARTKLIRFRAAMLADEAKRAARPWMLHHPPGDYTGSYTNPGFGTLVIEKQGDHLVACLGNLRAVLEPFKEPESARVELVPGSGEVLRFAFGSGDKADSVKWGDDPFVRQ